MNPKAITRRQAREVDRRAIEDLGFPGIVLMENAGRGCVDVMQRLAVQGPVLVIAGRGNNGGDGFVIARHLALRGVECRVALACPPHEIGGDALIAYRMLQPCGVTITQIQSGEIESQLDELGEGCEWIVDALLGTGAKGDPRPPYDQAIRWMNAQPAKRLAVDLPSGLDCDTGAPGEPTVRADHTCTFVAPKLGFTAPAALPCLGDFSVVGIGLPREIECT